MKECTVCIANRTDYPPVCPEGLENLNLCVDIVTDRLLDKLTAKGFNTVYHAFYVSHFKGSLEATVRIELVLNKVYAESVFESLPQGYTYYPTTFRLEFLNGKKPNLILNYTHPTRSPLMYVHEVDMSIVNARSTLVQSVEALIGLCEGV